jgi:hypothetical protein
VVVVVLGVMVRKAIEDDDENEHDKEAAGRDVIFLLVRALTPVMSRAAMVEHGMEGVVDLKQLALKPDAHGPLTIQPLKLPSRATGSPRAGNSLSFMGRTSTCFSLQLLVPKPRSSINLVASRIMGIRVSLRRRGLGFRGASIIISKTLPLDASKFLSSLMITRK